MTAPVAKKVAEKAAQTAATASSVKKTTPPSQPQTAPKESTRDKLSVNRRGNRKNKVGPVERAHYKFAPPLKPAKSVVRYRHMLAGEFVVCSIIILTEPSADDLTSVEHGVLVRESALIGAFLILSLLSVGGPSVARFSAAAGFVIMLTLMVNKRSVISKLTSLGQSAKKNAGAPSHSTSAGGQTTEHGGPEGPMPNPAINRGEHSGTG